MVGQLGAVSGEQLFLRLFCKVGLEDAHQLFLGDGSAPSISRNYSVSQRTEKIMLITLVVFLPSPPQGSVTTSVNIATGFLTGQYHYSFPDLTIIIVSFVPCADMEMVRGSVSVALKVPLILISSLSPQCQAKCWHTHLGMDT